MTTARVAARIVTLVVAIPLVVFSLRRILFTIAALAAPSPRPDRHPAGLLPIHTVPPQLLVLVPCRNDGAVLPELVSSLLTNGYPLDRLRILLIDDASTDDSAVVAARLSVVHAPVVQLLPLPHNHGKASALNAALAQEPWGEFLAVYDADHRPVPGALTGLIAPFADAQVGGVSGRTEIGNALVSPSAYYAAIERLVHQQVTMVAKDRLRLAPALLGSHCAYRRSLLEQLGGFAPGALLEDSDLTVRIAATGYRTRFLDGLPAVDQAPASLAGFWRQHVRWGRGFQDVAASQAGPLLHHQLPWRLRLELLAFSLGYVDRLALLIATALVLADVLFSAPFHFPRRFLAAVYLLPYAQVLVALVRTRKPPSWWLRLPFLLVLFPVDVAAAVRSTADTLLNRPRIWAPTDRSLHPDSHS